MERRDDEVPRPLLRGKRADMTPAEFEEFVVATFEQTRPLVEDLTITLHEKVTGVDGKYDFDATVRYRFGGMDFLVVVEAKHQRYPVKRDVVQTLHAKMQSVGAHKAVIVATAPYQRGALRYAEVHGIALVVVTGERFRYEVRMITDGPWDVERDMRSGSGFWGKSWRYTSETTLQGTVVTHQPERSAESLLGMTPPR